MHRKTVTEILSIVNNNINSNALIIEPYSGFNIIELAKIYMETRNSVKELCKSYPKQKLNKRHNLLMSLGQVYLNLYEANRIGDEAMLSRYLTKALYEQWRRNHSHLQMQAQIQNVDLLQAKLFANSFGRWVQCRIKITHSNSISKNHVVQRKLNQSQNHVRNWYFCSFQN